ncbi:MAG: PAS domain S-box protein [Bacillota bacterium]
MELTVGRQTWGKIPRTKNLGFFLLICISNYLLSKAIFPFLSAHQELVWHFAVETVCITVAVTVFLVSWLNYDAETPLGRLFGFAFLLVVIFPFMHMISYPCFFNKNPHLWAWFRNIGQSVEGLAFLAAAADYKTGRPKSQLLVLSLVTAFAVITILLTLRNIPPVYTTGGGLTPLGTWWLCLNCSGYLLLLLFKCNTGRGEVLNIFALAILCAAGTALFTAEPAGVYGIMGHNFNLLSHVFVLRGIIFLSSKHPYSELKLSEERYKKTFDANPNLTVITTCKDWRFISVNDSFYHSMGTCPERVIGHKADELNIWLSASDRGRIARTLAQNGVVRNLEVEFRSESQEIHKGLISAEIITLNNQKCILSVTVDITELKWAKDSLKMSEERCRQILETANEGTWIIDADNKTVFVNKKMAEMLGYTVEEMLGRPLLEFMEDKWEEIAESNIRRRGKGICEKLDFKYRRKNGDELWTIASVSPIFSKDGEYSGALGMIADVTERKRFEKEIARLDRLILAAEMAAAMAHEIRNPLSSVKGFLQLAGIREEGQCTWYRNYSALMIEELDRVNSIIREFLCLTRDNPGNKSAHNLNSSVETLYPLIESDAAAAGKAIKKELGEIPDLLLNENDMRQIILNLARNGLEAMNPGGLLTIRTYVEGKAVVLAVEDQGPGIEDAVLDKLGTPFLTTKKEGTGLGLPVCYSIAYRHDARIKVDTSSKGTVFYVKFEAPERMV